MKLIISLATRIIPRHYLQHVSHFFLQGNYGPFSITSNGEWDAFIFKMDKDGNWLWAAIHNHLVIYGILISCNA